MLDSLRIRAFPTRYILSNFAWKNRKYLAAHKPYIKPGGTFAVGETAATDSAVTSMWACV